MSRTLTRNSPATWVSGAFCPLDRAFLTLALPHLTARAIRVYMAHLKVANQGSGKSYAYRETLAAALDCSMDTVDRGNDELEKHGLIAADGRRHRCGGPVVWVLQSPSFWKFDTDKNAALTPQKREVDSAKVRHTTKKAEKKEFLKTDKAPHAVSVCVENSFPVVASPLPSESEELSPLALELFRAGVEPRLAAAKLALVDADRARVVLDYVAKNPHLGGAWIRKAIERPDSVTMKQSEPKISGSAQNGAAYSDYRPTDATQGDIPSDRIADTPRSNEHDTTPAILERRRRVQADIEACLALMNEAKAAAYRAGMAGFDLRQQVEYLERSAVEWDEVRRRH